MKYANFLKSKKTLALAVGIVIATTIAGLYFHSQKLPTYEISIDPTTELLPFASHKQARTNVCNAMKGQLFDEICHEKFDKVGKDDAERIGELFLLLEKIKNDNDISDYERYLLGHAVFASLPTKDSSLAQDPGSFAILFNSISPKNIAYAKEPGDNFGMGEEGFKKMMIEDLEKVVGDLPKGDNAWVISIMVSRHEWINGERQPIYSEQYGEIYNPYPGVEIEDKAELEMQELVHVHSRSGTYSRSENTYRDILEEGAGEMIAYHIGINSWHSRPYGKESVLALAEAGPPELYIRSEYHFTEEGYKGDNLLYDLLDAVEMPSREQLVANKKKAVPPPGTLIERSDAEFICGTTGCEACMSDSMGLYCFDNLGRLEELVGVETVSGDEVDLEIKNLLKDIEPTYRYTDAPEIEEPPADFPGFTEQNQAYQEDSYDSNYPKYNNQMRWLDCVKNSSLKEAENCDEILDQPEDDSYKPVQETETDTYVPDSVHTVPR